MKVSEEQYKKFVYVMDRKNLKLSTYLRDYLQKTIEKYEKENWKIITNQTRIDS